MDIGFKKGSAKLPAEAVSKYFEDLQARLATGPAELAEEAKADLALLKRRGGEIDAREFWPYARIAYEKRLLDLLPANGLPSVNYDLASGLNLEARPLGLDADFSTLRLHNRPTKIAGKLVDFPLGISASILTANSSFLEHYFDRGYSILTYKTVRSKHYSGHPFPQWVCLDQPSEFQAGQDGALTSIPEFVGRTNFFPQDPVKAAMANSFGIPSHAPSWWQEDVRVARKFIKEGHQLLVVSVMSSVSSREDLSSIVDDFVTTAALAKNAGADVIELNLSCPNTNERAAHGYQREDDAAEICKAVHLQLRDTPILAKIGYLPDDKLSSFVEKTWPFIDGIVAINAISAPVLDGDRPPMKNGKRLPLFAGEGRDVAGISGWSVQKVAQRLAESLVKIRNRIAHEHHKQLSLVGLGGVMTKGDFEARLATGVDAVEVCTGAYFNPLLGFEIRDAEGKIEVTTRDIIKRGSIPVHGQGALGRSQTGATKSSESGGKVVPRKATEQKAEVNQQPSAQPNANAEDDDLLSLVPDSAIDPARAKNLEAIRNMSSEEFFRVLEKSAPGNPYAEEMVRQAKKKKIIS